VKDRLDQLDLDVDLSSLKELRLPRRREPESSSAGFVAGMAVGVLLGIVLALLFGKRSDNDVVDQFTQRAEAFRGSAAEKLHHVRGPGHNDDPASEPSFDDEVAIEREVHADSGHVDTGAATIDDAHDAVSTAPETVADGEETRGHDGSERVS
jgi:gas vesicle protein